MPFASFAPRAALVLALASLAGCSADLTGSDAYDVQRYDLSGRFDWERDLLVAKVGITLTADPGVGGITLDSSVSAILAVHDASGEEREFAVNQADKTLTVDISGLGSAVSLTIDYEASPGEGLRAVRPRAGDPVGVRVVFTDSEPDRTALWMPCHARPDDRALFSADLRMAEDEVMISNGEVVADEASGGERRMKYDSKVPLPVYLMAFAVSDFEVEEGARASVWHRRGVAGDYPATLSDLDRLMQTFEGLLGPYPFNRYALVMLPEFSGGMENAGITFQSEVSTAEPALSGALNAHEFGHQWYGDAMTVATWDDVWIKEGMAVVLENEASRPFEDRGKAGTLFGDRLYVVVGDAIRDKSLAPNDKYTTGPYDRAAWLYTQIRAVAGEQAFWSTARDLLDQHRFGSVGTDALLAAFAPHLGGAAEAARRAVDAMGLPVLEVDPAPGGGARVTLVDSQGILIAPVEIEWRRESGKIERAALSPGKPMDLTRESEGDLLILDPDDIHPDLALFITDDPSYQSYQADLLPLTVPATAGALTTFTAVAGIHQYAALFNGPPPPLDPGEFEAFVASLDADSAQATATAAACALAAAADTATQKIWQGVVVGHVEADPVFRGLPYAARPGSCVGLLTPADLFAEEWAEVAAGLPSPSISATRLFYLSTFDLPFQSAVDTWSAAALGAYSLRTRTIAARSLRRAVGVAADGEDQSPWRAAVLDLLAKTDASEVLRQLTPAAAWFAGAPAADRRAFVDQMQRIVGSPRRLLAQTAALCGAYVATKDHPGEWEAFEATLTGVVLSRDSQGILDNPGVCL